MTDLRTCAACGSLSANTVSLVVSHRRAPVDGVDICVECAAELDLDCGAHRWPACRLMLGHKGVCEVVG